MRIIPTSEPLRPDRITPNTDAHTATASAEPVAQAERVQLSNLAARLNELEAQFGQADFDAKKVDEVRAAIAAGRFKVNPQAVADKLLDSVAELLGRK